MSADTVLKALQGRRRSTTRISTASSSGTTNRTRSLPCHNTISILVCLLIANQAVGRLSAFTLSTKPNVAVDQIMASPSSSASGTSMNMSKQKKKPRFSQHVHTKNEINDDANAENDDTNRNERSSTFYTRNRSSDGSRDRDIHDGRDGSSRRTIGTSSSRRLTTMRRSLNNKGSVLNSSKSIEDLEGIMARRWETVVSSPVQPSVAVKPVSKNKASNFQIDNRKTGSRTRTSNADIELDFGMEGDEYVYEEDDDDDDISEAVGWKRRPVLDPWDAEELKKQQKATTNKSSNEWKTPTISQQRSQRPVMREFYDEDDEGYEAEGYQRQDKNKRRSSSVLRVDHLIAPEPASGQRRRSPRSDSDDVENSRQSSQGSYFFNPDAARKSFSDDITGAKASVSAPQPKPSADDTNPRLTRPPPVKSKPLVGSDGQPLLFTVAEAFRRFEGTVDEKTREKIEAVDFPILAASRIRNDSNDDDGDSVLDSVSPPSWSDLGVTSPILLENLESMKCLAPLSVQEKTTPAILTGNDVLVGTYTGSGKTLAFLVPLIQRLLWNVENEHIDNTGISVLIVAPGRELASQIVSVTRELIEDTGLTAQLAIGGTTYSRNLEQIRKKKPDILVGTPGRIAELVVGKPGEKGGRLKTGSIQSLVMDEFDALFEYKPHRDPTEAIMQALKRRHGDSLQSILCSATATDIMESSKVTEFLRPGFETAMADDEDVLVTAAKGEKTKGSAQVSRTVLHGVVHLPHRRLALEAVRRILHTEPIPQQILIFVDNARKVDIVVDKLADRGIIAAPLHGGTPGSDSNANKMERAEVSKALREGYVGIVVCTELAARGLDAPLLTHVINLDLPTDSSHYAHRAGRCGRGGRPGVVINITTSPKERKVPQRFADSLGIEMHPVEPQSGKLVMLDPATIEYD